ncbi:MAG: hypothetical protein HY816_19925 [Candidatus Wallbacteria bacterium]|nr:hypothetical protein [Candidatus Wallbacteria bacterium]
MVTPNLGLNVPDPGLDPWDVPVNANWTKLDTVLAGIALDDDPLTLYIDPATVSVDDPNTMVDGLVGATVLPATLTTRLWAKWPVRTGGNLAVPLQLVLRLSFGAGSGTPATLRATAIPVQAGQRPSAATPVVVNQDVTVVAEGLQQEVSIPLTVPALSTMVALKIERFSDGFSGPVHLWDARLRFARLTT